MPILMSGGNIMMSAGGGAFATAASGELLFQDTFNYVVDREDAGTQAAFQAAGWTGCKSQSENSGAAGYVYTVDAIPGYAGAYPMEGRMLCLEALPETFGVQTDFYLEYGDGEDAFYNNYIPGDVWIQFWIFVNYSGSQLSQLTEEKFLYACNGSYGCHTHNWMQTMGFSSNVPHWAELGTAGVTNGDMYLRCAANWEVDTVTNPLADAGDEWKMGQTDISEWIKPNRWQRVTHHMNTTGGYGSWEAWIKPMGGTEVKVADWVSGVGGFSWPISNSLTGHRTFRMPTTVGSTGGPWYDHWSYYQDFIISESSLL